MAGSFMEASKTSKGERPRRYLKAGNKGKHSSLVGPKCERARPGKLVGARTTLFFGVNGLVLGLTR